MGRARHLAVLLLVAVALAGCEGTRSTFVPLPPLGGAKSVIASAATATKRHLVARAIEPALVLELPIEELGTATVSVLGYRRSLDELDLDEGDLPLARGGEPSFTLPAPDSLASAKVLGGVASAWASESLDRGLFDVKLAGTRRDASPCARITLESMELGAASNPSFLVALDPEVALVATMAGDFFTLRERRTITPLRFLGASTPHRAAFVRTPGEVWLAGSNHGLARGAPDVAGGLVTISTSTTGSSFYAVAGTSTTSALELLLVTSKGGVERYDGARFATLHPEGAVVDWGRDVAWLDGREAIVAGASGGGVLRYRDGMLRAEPIDGAFTPVSVVRHPTLGPLVGTFEGAVLHEDGGAWRPLGASPLALAVATIAATPRGFVAAGGGGLLVEWVDGHGYCEPVQTAYAIVKHAIAMGDGLVLTGDRPAGSTSSALVTIAELDPP